LTEATIKPAEKRTTLWALALVLLLGALDQTIIATAMPRIIEQLSGMTLYAWVTTSYLLTSTIVVPIYGKLSDLYGRKPILLIGVVLFLLGSILCGLSGEFGDLPGLGGGMTQLIVFRAVQGLGGGALMSMVFSAVADLVPPRERGRYFGMFGGVFGLATVIGPFIGGYFTDHGTIHLLGHEIAGWRWVFYVNLPLGILALFMIAFRMPHLRHGSGGRVDYLGALLIVCIVTPLLLGLTWAGSSHTWTSPPILGLFAASAVALCLFIVVELRVQEPILPLHLFANHTFRRAIVAAFIISMAFLGVVMFMPLYMQVVQGVSATQSGISLLPLMFGLILSSTLCGRLVTRTGRYKPFMVGGAIVFLIGVVCLSQIGPDTTTRDLAWRLALTGLGLGPAQNLFGLVVQNAVPMTQLGTATSMNQFSRQMGSTVGVAIFGTLLITSLTVQLPRSLPVLPGTTVYKVDLEHAQSQAMDTELIRSHIEQVMSGQSRLIEQAYRGDAQAAADVLAETRIPEEVKAPLRDGGIRARIHHDLTQRGDRIAAALERGSEGIGELLEDPELPETLKRQLQRVPARALRDDELTHGVASLFREALLAHEDEQVTAATQQALQTAQTAMQRYSEQLIGDTERGMKLAFAASISDMLSRALWIVAIGAFIILLIPELPLRSRQTDIQEQ
jgi:EmrB/QacA subfamily drug resistance transporter